LVLLLMAVAVLGYFGGLLRLWSDGVHWPLSRLAWWLGGWACVGATLVGPLAEHAHHDLAGHMVAHVLVGMLAPLLLVGSAPVTLLLRVLPPAGARRFGRVLTARPVAVLTHPVTATLINVGGLSLLYRTGLLAATLADPWTHLAVSLHVVAAGYLFTFAILGGPDPAPHRAPAAWRAGALVAAVAAHNILAKLLHAHPPPGVPAQQAEAAGQVMYYGAAPVEIVLIFLVCRAWLLPRRRRPGSSPTVRRRHPPRPHARKSRPLPHR
jgi:putative membrane protein